MLSAPGRYGGGDQSIAALINGLPFTRIRSRKTPPPAAVGRARLRRPARRWFKQHVGSAAAHSLDAGRAWQYKQRALTYPRSLFHDNSKFVDVGTNTAPQLVL